MYWSLSCNWSQTNFSITHLNLVAENFRYNILFNARVNNTLLLSILLFTSIFCCRGPYFKETENQLFWGITVALAKQISHLLGHFFEIIQTLSEWKVARSNELLKQCSLSVKTNVFQNLSIFLDFLELYLMWKMWHLCKTKWKPSLTLIIKSSIPVNTVTKYYIKSQAQISDLLKKETDNFIFINQNGL